MCVWFGADFVESQFNFEIGFIVAQINQRETVKVKIIGDSESECLAVEIYGPVQVENPDHRVYGFWHANFSHFPKYWTKNP